MRCIRNLILLTLFLPLLIFQTGPVFPARADLDEGDGALWVAEAGGGAEDRHPGRCSRIEDSPLEARGGDGGGRREAAAVVGRGIRAHRLRLRRGAGGAPGPARYPRGRALPWRLLPEDGSIWLGAGRQLLAFGPFGQEFHRQQQLAAPISGLAIDAESGALWVSSGRMLSSFDAVGGTKLEDYGSPAAVTAFDVESMDGNLWVAARDGLRRVSEDGRELFAAALSPDALVADGAGGLWVAVGPDLMKVDAHGEAGISLRPLRRRSAGGAPPLRPGPSGDLGHRRLPHRQSERRG